MSAMPEVAADASLVRLGRALLCSGYRFTTVTPLTHAGYMARRPGRLAADARDVFGWNLPFADDLLPAEQMAWMREARVLHRVEEGWRSAVRFSSLGPGLYAHGGYPTAERDAVFFGPDTYRFVAFLQQHVQHAARAVDIGSGSGAGGLALGARLDSLICADLSAQALRVSTINAAINADSPAGKPGRIAFCESDLYRDLDGIFDLIIANPPYIQDDDQRLYRHGGSRMGIDLSVRIVREGLSCLAPGGQLLLYTGSPVVRGEVWVEQAVRELLRTAGEPYSATYEELDPDVFSEELARPCYHAAERLAVVGIVVRRRRG